MYFFVIFMCDLDNLDVFYTNLTRNDFEEAWEAVKKDSLFMVKRDGEEVPVNLLEVLSDQKLYLSASAALGAGIRFQKKAQMHRKNCNRAQSSKCKRKKKEYKMAHPKDLEN